MKKSFPDYDNAPLFRWCLAKLAPLGAVDDSWHNNSAPTIRLDLPIDDRIILMVDYKDANAREVDGATLSVFSDTFGDQYFESPRRALAEFAWQAVQAWCRGIAAPSKPVEIAALKLLIELGE